MTHNINNYLLTLFYAGSLIFILSLIRQDTKHVPLFNKTLITDCNPHAKGINYLFIVIILAEETLFNFLV